MPSARQIVQLSPAIRRPSVERRGGRFSVAICRGLRAIRSFRVQLGLDSLGSMPRTIWARPGTSACPNSWAVSPLMEPTMISPKVLSTVAAIALVLPMAVPTASFAQNPPGGHAPRVVGSGGAAHVSGGGGAPRMGMGMGAGGGVHMGGGAPPMGAAPGPRLGGGGGVAMGGGAPGPRYSGGGGGGYRAGYDSGRRRDRDGGGFFPGAVAGALVGGAIASQGYYGGPGYYTPGYYDDQYYDDSVVAVAPAPGGDDAVAYCMQTYRSYDPQSGTYLGNDGYRHPCP